MPVVQQQQQQQQESLKRARTSRRGQGGSQEAPVHPSMPAGKQQRTSQPHASEGGEGDDKRVPATTGAPQKTNELICLENPQIRGMEFQMDLIPEKELTSSLPGDVVSFQKLARFRNGKRAYHFIDNTLMIQSIMEEHMFKRIYVTGPRRFGKSVNLSMFESFLDSHCSGNQPIKEKNRRLFQDLKISKVEKFCADHQQQYFVIKLDFSSLNDTTMLETQGPLAGIMFEVYNQFVGICLEPYFLKHISLLGDFMLGIINSEKILKNS
jgi:Predicted AAA-ATPase